jgi:hypothetical protein
VGEDGRTLAEGRASFVRVDAPEQD